MKRLFQFVGCLGLAGAMSGCGGGDEQQVDLPDIEASSPPLTPEEEAANVAPTIFDPFEGGDLTDWIMDPQLWTARDGVIVGKTDGKLPHNQFLIWAGAELQDFEVTCELKLIGDNNSGIQYRSELLSEVGPDVMKGYQCDVHPNPPYAGMLYDERGRGIVATRGQKVVIMPDGRKLLLEETGEIAEVNVHDWNSYTVRAEGNRLRHSINGALAVEIIDLQESERELSGGLAFQIHRGNPMEVHIRNIRIEMLPPAALLTEADVEIPADAVEVHPPKQKGQGKSKPKGPETSGN